MEYTQVTDLLDDMMMTASLSDILLSLSVLCAEDYPRACPLLLDARQIAVQEERA